MRKRWNIMPMTEAAAELAGSLKTSPIIAQMLINRGITGPADGAAFLSPSLRQLHDPASMPNLTRAAHRIVKAIRDRKKIVIYGDYDVDGITATSILWHAITILGGVVEYYIPHRLEEGYGLNAEALKQICDDGAELIVSVDCGVTAVEEARVVAERGVDLIVTDHHEWKESHTPSSGSDGEPTPTPGVLGEGNAILPECYCIVHPRLAGDGTAYGNPYLCGAGVAFKLAWGIGLAHSGGSRVSEEFKQFLVEATALAALGTIADVVPLVGENRTLAHFGLGGLKQSRLIGIKALIASAGLTGQKLDSYHVGFLLAPRLNASGRMGHAALAVEMLTKADQAHAEEIAVYLEEQNRQRQSIERKIADEAIEQALKLGFDKPDKRGIVLGAEGWHPGVIGIVASRIVNRFNKPAIMVALSNGHGQGSGRSIPGFHLARALDACREHLEGSGGHEMAAGLRMASDKFEQFREAFVNHANQTVSEQMLIPELHLDCLAELRQVTEAMVTDMQRLGPFGTSNRKPLLCCEGVEIAAVPRRVGKTGDHLQIVVRQGGSSIKCIAFNYGKMFDRLQPGIRIDLAAEPSINEYNGYRNVQLEVKDLRLPVG